MIEGNYKEGSKPSFFMSVSFCECSRQIAHIAHMDFLLDFFLCWRYISHLREADNRWLKAGNGGREESLDFLGTR